MTTDQDLDRYAGTLAVRLTRIVDFAAANDPVERQTRERRRLQRRLDHIESTARQLWEEHQTVSARLNRLDRAV